MENQIVDVTFEDNLVSICQIIRETDDDYVVSELVYKSYGTYAFSNDYQTIPKNSVSGFYDTTSLEDTGLYSKIKDGLYEEVDSSDEDYEESSEDEYSSDSDISLDDEE